METTNNALCIAVLKRFDNTNTVLVKVYRPFSDDEKLAYTDALSLDAVGLKDGGVLRNAEEVTYVHMKNDEGKLMYTSCKKKIPLYALRIKL